jgi:tetratricopeptide (TPR) repeat protein
MLVLVAVLCLGCCAVLAGAYLFLFPLVFPGPGIGPRLAEIDGAIAGGYLSTARAQLLAIRTLPHSEAEALRVLKRAFILSRQQGSFDLLAVMADRALASVPASPTVRLLAAYAFLRTGRLSEADAAARRGLPGGRGEVLRAEISLKRGTSWQGSDSMTRSLLGLEASRRPSDFLAAAGVVNDSRINLDGALLLLEKGELARARAVAVSSLQDAAFDEPAALIFYDSGDFETAITRLKRLESRQQARGVPRADVELLLADCYHALGMEADFADALQSAVRLDPGVSWTPYADLGLIAEQKGNTVAAAEELARGRMLFPASRELVLAAARMETGRGNQAGAITLLDGLVSQGPQDAEAALLLLRLESPELAPQAYRAALWRLFERQPSNQAVFLTLAAALIASHDWDGAGIAVHQRELAQGAADADTLCYHGLIEAMQGKENQAMVAFEQAATLDRSGRSRYDLAVLLYHKGSAQEALAQLDQAAQESAPAGDERTASVALLAARIQALRGRCLERSGDLAGARSAFLRARALDPHELQAGFELRKLEAQGDR